MVKDEGHAVFTTHGGQKQFNSSQVSLAGSQVTSVTVMNTCKICHILVKGNSAGVDGLR